MAAIRGGEFMIKMLPGMIYAWLVLWIIPFYPHYRKAFKAKWFQIASCALCAAVLVCVCVVVSWKKRNELILILPLLIVCSYVDIRDQVEKTLDMRELVFYKLQNRDAKQKHVVWYTP